MKRVMVSGCFDIIHEGHVRFLKAARALGDHLTVCFASDATIRAYKGHEPATREDDRRAVLESFRFVDAVVMGDDMNEETAWEDYIRWTDANRTNVIATTSDDPNCENKRLDERSVCYVAIMPAKGLRVTSSSAIRERILNSKKSD